MRALPRLLVSLALLPVAVVACGGDSAASGGSEEGLVSPDQEMAGGSSGSEGYGTGDQASGGDTVTCPCGLGDVVIRATVEQVGDEEVTLRVGELLHGEHSLAAGDTLQARFVGRLPCYSGTLEVQAEQQVLAVLHGNNMLDAEHWVDVRLSPWEETLLFAKTDQAELRVSADQLDELWGDLSTCVESYGDWGNLPGSGTDGTSDEYYCVDENGSERLCASVDPCPEQTCIETPLCDSDADCEQDRICHGFMRRVCPDDLDTACMDGESDQDCADRTADLLQSECTNAEEEVCTPRWNLPCESDESCGEGFRCASSNCEPLNPDCDNDQDCPGGWLCRTFDGGYCEGGAGCVNNQTQVTACVPPAITGASGTDG